MHNIGVTWHKCHICNYRTKQKGHITRHLAAAHEIDVQWHKCHLCSFQAKQKSHVTRHLADKHDINVKWHKCHICSFRAKQSCALTKHLAFAHDIGVEWHECREPGCSFRAKQQCNLLKHLESVHDIGRHRCEYCLGNRNSRIAYFDESLDAEVMICRGCFHKVTGRQKRIEHEWAEYVDQHLGTEGLVGTDSSLLSLGGCSRKRPDRIYADSNFIEIDECDENGHGSYLCEQGRLMELYEDPSLYGKAMTVIRWNPHNTREIKTPLSERLALFVELKRAIRARRNTTTPHDQLRLIIFYMFFNPNSPAICRDIAHRFVTNSHDVVSATSEL